MSSDTDYGAGWDAGFADGRRERLADGAVRARLLTGWYPQGVDTDKPRWLKAYPYDLTNDDEPMTIQEAEIVRSALAELHKETP